MARIDNDSIVRQNLDAIHENKKAIIITGRIGHGKSSIANAILRCDHFPTKMSHKPVTQHCSINSKHDKFIIVDTPGVELGKYMQGGIPLVDVHAIVIVVACDRVNTFEDLSTTIKLVLDLFGNIEIERYSILAFTHAGQFDDDTALEEYLKELGPEVNEFLLKWTHRWLGFNVVDKYNSKLRINGDRFQLYYDAMDQLDHLLGILEDVFHSNNNTPYLLHNDTQDVHLQTMEVEAPQILHRKKETINQEMEHGTNIQSDLENHLQNMEVEATQIVNEELKAIPHRNKEAINQGPINNEERQHEYANIESDLKLKSQNNTSKNKYLEPMTWGILSKEPYQTLDMSNTIETNATSHIELPRNILHKEMQHHRTLLLIGKIGTGKSATGNTILNYKPFESRNRTNRITTKCQHAQSSIQANHLQYVIDIVDTPGIENLLQPNQSALELKHKIIEFFSQENIRFQGIHAFIVVVSCDRMTPQEMETIKSLLHVFGDKATNYFIMVLTKVDQLRDDVDDDDDVITNLKDYIKTYWPTLDDLLTSKFKGRFVAFNNKLKHTDPNCKKQVNELLQIVDKVIHDNGNQAFVIEHV